VNYGTQPAIVELLYRRSRVAAAEEGTLNLLGVCLRGGSMRGDQFMALMERGMSFHKNGRACLRAIEARRRLW
jgi:hypothetical protein